MRGADLEHLLLRLSLITCCCRAYPSAAPAGENYNLGYKVSEVEVPYHLESVDSDVRFSEEPARRFVRRKRSIDSDFWVEHEGKENISTELPEQSIISIGFYTPTTRTHVKKRMLYPKMTFNLEPIENIIESIIHLNGTEKVASAPWKTPDQKELDFLSMQEIGRDVRKFETNVNEMEWSSKLFWPTHTGLFKDIIKGQKNESNPNESNNVGDVAIINIEILKIPKSSESPEPDVTSLDLSTNSARKLLVSIQSSQNYSEIATKKANMNEANSEFKDFMSMINDFDRKLIKLEKNSQNNNFKPKQDLKLRQISDAKKSVERRRKHLINALTGDRNPLVSVSKHGRFSEYVGSYPNEHEQMQTTTERIGRTKHATWKTLSQVRSTLVSSENYFPFSKIIVTYPNKQELQMTNAVEKIEGRKHILDTLLQLKRPTGIVENYEAFSAIVNTYPSNQQEQMKNTMETIKKRIKELVTLIAGISNPITDANDVFYAETISSYVNKQEKMNTMDMIAGRRHMLYTLPEVKRPLESAENFETFSVVINTNPNIQEEQRKTTMENTEKARKLMPMLSKGNSTPLLKVNVTLYADSIEPYLNKQEDKTNDDMDMIERRKQLLTTFSEAIILRQSKGNNEPFSGGIHRLEKTSTKLLNTLSEGRTPAVSAENYNVYKFITGTYPNTHVAYQFKDKGK